MYLELDLEMFSRFSPEYLRSIVDYLCQFLIGNVSHEYDANGNMIYYKVSIPHR